MADWARANDILSGYHLVEGVNINHAWDHFYSFFMNVIDQCVQKKNLLSVKPRIHPGLIVSCVKCVGKKQMLFRKWKNLRTMIFTLSTNVIVTSYTNILKHAKRVFFDSLLDDASPCKTLLELL